MDALFLNVIVGNNKIQDKRLQTTIPPISTEVVPTAHVITIQVTVENHQMTTNTFNFTAPIQTVEKPLFEIMEEFVRNDERFVWVYQIIEIMC